MDTSDRPAAVAGSTVPRDLGARLRARRLHAGIGLRELAGRIGVSASLVSQIETGKVQPSVNTLYALASQLGGSIDEIVFDDVVQDRAEAGTEAMDGPKAAEPQSALTAWLLAHPPVAGVQRRAQRQGIRLQRGVRWERLTTTSVPGLEFLLVTYEPGAESSSPGDFQRHNGREWAYVVTGDLHIEVGGDTYVLQAGDAVTYDASTPHRLHNCGPEPVEAVWFQLG